ncbi:nitroreductase family protein [Gottschalkiaceae bacterium SANA]|nr:nitroreductase family protein [Gottschalkiaceae bacterium SANA]
MIKAIQERRSVRKFTKQMIDDSKIEILLRAAMQAPSAANQQPWEFFVARKPETKERLSKLSPYAGSIADAPVAIVILANTERLKFPEHMEQDMGAATENLLLQAVEMDLGAVWLGVAPNVDRMKHVRTLLNLPENLLPYAVVPVGVPDGMGNHFVDRFDASRIHFETVD